MLSIQSREMEFMESQEYLAFSKIYEKVILCKESTTVLWPSMLEDEAEEFWI